MFICLQESTARHTSSDCNLVQFLRLKGRASMILGMSTATYTFLHVLISLIGIGSGLIVMYGFLKVKPWGGLNAIFLITTVLTSVTGFGFPFDHLGPAHKVGILSLVVLAIAIPAPPTPSALPAPPPARRTFSIRKSHP